MPFAAPPVLITGATGFIGGRLAQRLLAAGTPIRVLVRDPGRLPAGIRAGAQVVQADLLDTQGLATAVRGAAVVFHCAANVRTWDTWEAYHAANVTGVRHLVQAIAQHNPGLPRLVHLSTVDVYGYPVQACDEHCPSDGGAFGYGRSKAQGEAALRSAAAAAAIAFTILRPANVIGPGSQFISRIGAELRGGLMLTIDGGRANAGLLHVDNLVDRMLWAAHAPAAAGQTFNVRDAYDVSWAQVLQALRRAIGGRGRILNMPFALADALAGGAEALHRRLMPAREPLLHRLLVRMFGRTCGHSADKIRQHSGMADAIGYDEALQQCARWFLARPA